MKMKLRIFVICFCLVILTSCHKGIHLALIPKTGERGVVMYEIRDFETKEKMFYEIDTDKGVIRVKPNEISIFKP
jgi:hypothetical protein